MSAADSGSAATDSLTGVGSLATSSGVDGGRRKSVSRGESHFNSTPSDAVLRGTTPRLTPSYAIPFVTTSNNKSGTSSRRNSQSRASVASTVFLGSQDYIPSDGEEEQPLNILDEDGEVTFFTKEPNTIDPFEDLKTLYKGHTDAVVAMALDQLDKRLYTASWDNEVIIWNVFTRDKIGVLPHGCWVNDIQIVRVHADPREARNNSPAMFSSPTTSAQRTSPSQEGKSSQDGGSNSRNPSVAFDNTNNLDFMSGIFSVTSGDHSSNLAKTKFIVTACEDGNVTVWDPNELTVVYQLAPSFAAVTGLTVTHDLIFAASLWSIYAISLSSGTVVREYTDRSDVNCMVTYEDQIFCGLQDGRLLCWDVVGAFVLREMKGHGPDGGVRDMLIHVPSNAIYSCGDDGRVKIWTLSTGTCLHAIRISTKPLRSLALHIGGAAPDRFLYVGGFDGQVRLLRLGNAQFRTVRNFLADCMLVYDDGISAHLIAGDHSGVVQSFTLKATEELASKLFV